MDTDSGNGVAVRSVPTSAQVLAAAGQVGRAKARAKWPPEVRRVNQNSGRAVKPFATVFEGYRALVLAGRRLRFEWRSLMSVGFWATAKDAPVFPGKTLAEATLKLAEWARGQ